MAVTEQFHYSTLERGVGSSPTLVNTFFFFFLLLRALLRSTFWQAE